MHTTFATGKTLKRNRHHNKLKFGWVDVGSLPLVFDVNSMMKRNNHLSSFYSIVCSLATNDSELTAGSFTISSQPLLMSFWDDFCHAFISYKFYHIPYYLYSGTLSKLTSHFLITLFSHGQWDRQICVIKSFFFMIKFVCWACPKYSHPPLNGQESA